MKDIRSLKKMIYQLNYILTRRQRKNAIGIFFAIFIGALFEMLGVSAMLPFIQVLAAPEELLNKRYIIVLMDLFGINDTSNLVLYICGGIILIYIIKNCYLLFSSYLQILFKTNLLQNLSVLMLQSYMNRPYKFFVNTNSGKIMRGITNDVAGVHDIIEIGFKLLSEILVAILISIYLLYIDCFLALGVLCAGTICLGVIIILFKGNLARVGKVNRESIAENNQYALQIVSGIKDIFVMQKKDAFLREYKNSYIKRTKASVSYNFAIACPERIIEVVCIIGIIGILFIRIRRGVDMALFVPQLAVFAMAAFRILPSISRISGYINGIIFYKSTLEAAYENIKDARDYMVSNEQKDKNERGARINEVSLEKEIVIQNIEFSYENGKKVIDDLAVRIKKGESIGIIGESGAGKSTLSDILLGLYTPQRGKVCLDGKDIFEIPIAWSKLVGYVPQNVFLLDASIRDNVIFGDKEYNEEDIWRALESANLKEYVQKLPCKLDTVVGERGIKFSGGQRQRIAIARALYHNPDVLVLDEATSALDNDTEAAVMEAIEALQGHKTLIIIAHRLSTIRNCDKIYEIIDGKAVLRDKTEIFEALT